MFEFEVKPDNGNNFRVTATARDVLLWERNNKGASMVQLQQDMHMGDLYSIAYYAAKRQRLYDGTLKDFEESCDVDILDPEDDDANPPTRSAA